MLTKEMVLRIGLFSLFLTSLITGVMYFIVDTLNETRDRKKKRYEKVLTRLNVLFTLLSAAGIVVMIFLYVS